jgi:hypothetical protein
MISLRSVRVDVILWSSEDVSVVKALGVIGWRMKERRRPVLGNNLVVEGVIRLYWSRVSVQRIFA